MIMDIDFMGQGNGSFYDNPINTKMLDTLTIYEGTYDRAYINLDKTLDYSTTSKGENWSLTTVMDAEFTNDLDAGSVNAEGFVITDVLLYRRTYGMDDWEAIGVFQYNPKYNLYVYDDRYVGNGTMYQYAIVPVANEIEGAKLESEPIKANYDGAFLTDKTSNKKMIYDLVIGDMTYNQNSATLNPIYSKYPVTTFGSSRFTSGTITFLPLASQTVKNYGEIDVFLEHQNKKQWIDFINNKKAKILRLENGEVLMIVTKSSTKSIKENLPHLAEISFDYNEINEINYATLYSNDLLPVTYLKEFTYDESGDVIEK